MKGWPYRTHPTGWYQVDWTWDLQPGDVKPMRLFSEDLVLYRTTGGQAVMLDAHCPHLGANLGHGGCVVGENLQCPWHGWQWNVDGRNVHIPFVDRIHERARIRRWELRETDGIILVWYDALDRPPGWEWPGVPEFRDPVNFYEPQLGTHRYGILPVIPQLPVENNADLLHFPFVHGAGQPATHLRFEEDGPSLRMDMGVLFGAGKASTWMTPDGPVEGVIEGQMWAIGLGLAKVILGDVVVPQFVGITPVDEDHSVIFSTATGLRDPNHPEGPAGATKAIMDAQVTQLANDFNIWKHQVYRERPLFVGSEERVYARLRRWTHQFYPDAEITADGIEAGAVAGPGNG